MDIPVYHKYTLAHAWDKAMMLQTRSSELSFLEKRAKCLKRMCKRFYVQKMKILEDDNTPPEEPEGTLLHPPSQAAASPAISASPGQVGLAQWAYATGNVKKCLVKNDRSTRPPVSFEHSATLETRSVNLVGDWIPRAEFEVKEAPITEKGMPSAGTCVLADSTMSEEQPDGATEDFRSALLTSCFEANLRRKPVSASFPYEPPEEDVIHKSEVTVSSPHSDSSDETCVNTPDQATSPIILEVSGLKLKTTLHYEDEQMSAGQSLDDLTIQKLALEVGQPLLPPCCNKIKEEWEHTVKIIEGNHETETANMKVDLDGLQDLRQSLEMEKTHLTQDHKETLRKLREKGKEVRELKRELKTKSETLSAKEGLERSRADTTQNLENDFSSQMKELERTHKKTLQGLKDQHYNELNELERTLDVKSKELSKKADLMQDWKDEAMRLQAQHDDICQGGKSCTQQIDSLKIQLAKRERWIRQIWPMLQHELQDANTKLAVAQQNLEKAEEKARNDTTEATLRFSRLNLKWKVANEGLRQAKRMLLADDAKAFSVGILQESADEMANLMTQNHDRVVEILDLYRKGDIILQGHQDQINACYAYIGELEVDKENLRTANIRLESDFMALDGRYQSLQQKTTDLQITNNDLQIANNNLQINHYNLVRDNTALQADKKSLELRNTWLENERSKISKETEAHNLQDALLQREKSCIGPDENQLPQNVPKPEYKNATLGAKKKSLQDQIDEAYPAQQEAFAALRAQEKSWITTAQKSDDSKKTLPRPFHMREATSIPPPKVSSKETSPQDNSTHTNTPASPLPIKKNITDTLDERPITSNTTSHFQKAATLIQMNPHPLQEINVVSHQDIAMTPSKQQNAKSTKSISNTIFINEETQTTREIETPKPHKMVKERGEGVLTVQGEKVAVQGRVMSKKERRAMRKRG